MQHSLRYYTDVTDAQWTVLCKWISKPCSHGRPIVHSRRELINAIFYVARTGCAWRLLPKDFAPWQTVYGYFRQGRIHGLWQRIHDHLREQVRSMEGRRRQPSVAILDSQTVKAAEPGGIRGYDAAKHLTGRKRHLLVDTLGLLWRVGVTAASVQDRDGAKPLLAPLARECTRLRRIWADGGYRGRLVEWVRRLRAQRRIELEIVERAEGQKGFAVLPKRWIVERTFGWLVKWRRLRCDYERLTATSEAMIHAAMIGVMLRRIA